MDEHKDTRQTQVTQLLESLAETPGSLERLADMIYDDIRRLARHQRYRMGGGDTLRTTALVHEAFLKVFPANRDPTIADRQHLMRVMSQAMRHLMVDHARRHLADKRGGGAVHVEFDEHQVAAEESDIGRVLALESALERLVDFDPALAELVQFRYFAGYTTDEIAAANDVSRRTVQRQLQRANAWLRMELGTEFVG